MSRYTSHYIHLPSGEFISRKVVELENGRVMRLFSWEEEPEDTVWLPGVIYLVPDGEQEEGLVAIHFSCFDFTAWQPVGGTPHTQLR